MLDGLQIDLPDDDVSIVIPSAATKGDETFIRNLELQPPIGFDPKLLHPDFTVDLDTMNIEGTVAIAELAASVSARLKKKFSGEVRLTTGPSSLNLYAGGGMKVEVADPLVTMKRAAELDGGKSVQIGKLGAVRLVYTSADSHLYVEKPYLFDLEYVQLVPGTTSRAVWIKVKQIDLRQFDASFAKGMSVNIPSLDITDAFFSINLLALMGKSAADSDADASPSSYDATSIRPAMDSLDGSIGVEMYVSTDILGLKDVHIGTDTQPLVVPIVKGEIDIPTFEKNIKGMIHTVQIGEGWYLRPWVVNVVADDPLLAIHDNRVELGVYYVNPPTGVSKGNDPDEKNRPNSRAWKPILKWDLRHLDLTRAYANKFSLWSAVFDLHSDPPKTADDIAKMSEKDRKEYEAEKKAAEEMMQKSRNPQARRRLLDAQHRADQRAGLERRRQGLYRAEQGRSPQSHPQGRHPGRRKTARAARCQPGPARSRPRRLLARRDRPDALRLCGAQREGRSEDAYRPLDVAHRQDHNRRAEERLADVHRPQTSLAAHRHDHEGACGGHPVVGVLTGGDEPILIMQIRAGRRISGQPDAASVNRPPRLKSAKSDRA